MHPIDEQLPEELMSNPAVLGQQIQARGDNGASPSRMETTRARQALHLTVAYLEADAGVELYPDRQARLPGKPSRERNTPQFRATDANILRLRGIPTARVGMPKVPLGPEGQAPNFTRGMNLLDLAEARRLVEILLRIVRLCSNRGPTDVMSGQGVNSVVAKGAADA